MKKQTNIPLSEKVFAENNMVRIADVEEAVRQLKDEIESEITLWGHTPKIELIIDKIFGFEDETDGK